MKKQAANGNANSNINTSTSTPFLLPDTNVEFPSVQEKEEKPKIIKPSTNSKSTVKPKVTIPKNSTSTSSTSAAPKRRRIGLSKSELTGKSPVTADSIAPSEEQEISLDETPLTMHKKKNDIPKQDPEVQKKKPLVRTHISWLKKCAQNNTLGTPQRVYAFQTVNQLNP